MGTVKVSCAYFFIAPSDIHGLKIQNSVIRLCYSEPLPGFLLSASASPTYFAFRTHKFLLLRGWLCTLVYWHFLRLLLLLSFGGNSVSVFLQSISVSSSLLPTTTPALSTFAMFFSFRGAPQAQSSPSIYFVKVGRSCSFPFFPPHIPCIIWIPRLGKRCHGRIYYVGQDWRFLGVNPVMKTNKSGWAMLRTINKYWHWIKDWIKVDSNYQARGSISGIIQWWLFEFPTDFQMTRFALQGSFGFSFSFAALEGLGSSSFYTVRFFLLWHGWIEFYLKSHSIYISICDLVQHLLILELSTSETLPWLPFLFWTFIQCLPLWMFYTHLTTERVQRVEAWCF